MRNYRNNEYLALWTLLLAAFTVMTALSMVGTVEVWGFELRSPGIAERLIREPDTATVVTATENQAIAKAVTIDSAAQRILIIGDSMLEGLNPRLAAYAKANGHTLNSVIWYSSTTDYWGKCDTLTVFIRRFRPTFIFISLGANELFVNNIAERRKSSVGHILKQIGDIPYLWIGPPNWKDDTGINRLIASSVKPGCYFKSDGMTFDRKKDGAHPTAESAAEWMDSIARWMPHHSSHPILLEFPGMIEKARPASVTVLQPKK